MSAPQPAAPTGPIAWLIGTCARHPGLTALLVAASAAWGVWSLRQIPLDAIPDLSDVQVIVYTEWPGRSAQLVEDQLTYPISSQLLAAPGVRAVRGQSFFGLSFVYAIFDDDTDLYWARSRVLEYMAGVEDRLPDGVTPVIGPDATGVGWVFEYALVDRTGRHDLAELRSLQDYYLRYPLSSVDGVSEVASFGGFVKEYQVVLDPERVRAFGLRTSAIADAIRRSNDDVGGSVVERGEQE
ncbi:MAG TPA: efflux RND transporter permease subunit, partial [Myxococcota bacterium]|nr:efflux RND transporter permease subunit [Myxococcota bacterium]